MKVGKRRGKKEVGRCKGKSWVLNLQAVTNQKLWGPSELQFPLWFWKGGEEQFRRDQRTFSFKNNVGASLVVQWLRIRLPMQGTRVQALVPEDSTCRRAAGPVSHNYWAWASGACAPQQETPRQWEVHAPRWRVAPTCHNWRKPSHRDEDPTQPKINK